MSTKNLKLKIDIDSTQATKGADGLKKSLSGLSSTLKTAVVGAAAAAGSALTALAGTVAFTGVKYNALMEQSQIAWATLVKDSKKADEIIQKLKTMGAQTPFEFEELDKAAKLLNMAGYEGENLFSTLQNVGDAVSAIGGSADDLTGVSMAIFQMASKGKVSAEEMNQLAERGIPAWKLVAEAMGKSVPELMKMSEQGKLMAADVLPLLTEQMGKTFGGSMQAQSKTFNGLMSTMKDNFKMISAELSKPLFDKLKQGLEVLVPIMEDALKLLKGDMTDFKLYLYTTFGAETYGKIMTFVNKFMEMKDRVSEVVGVVLSVFKEFVGIYIEYAKGLFSGDGNIGESFTRIFDTIKSIALPILEDAIAFIKETLGKLKQFWDENGAQIIQAVQNMWSMIATIFNAIAPVLSFIVGMIWDSIKGVINGALNVILGIIKIFAGLFTGDFGKMWEGIKQAFVGAIEFIWNWLNLMFIGRIFSGIKAFIVGLVKSVGGLWTAIKAAFTGGINSVVSGVRGFVTNVSNGWTTLRAVGAGIFESIKQTAIYAFNILKNSVVNTVTGLKNSVVTIFNNLKSALGSVISGVADAITRPIGTAKDRVMDIIKAIKDGFSKLSINIPKPKLPHIKWSMKDVGGIVKIPSFSIDWYKKGGIFNGPSVVGVGEAGSEAVVPLQGHRMRPFAQEVANEMPQGSNSSGSGEVNNYFNIASLVVREQADIKRIASELYYIQQRQNRK